MPPRVDQSGSTTPAPWRTLRALSFSVVEVHDGSKAQIEAAITRRAPRWTATRRSGRLYYAARRMQLNWHNYIMPVERVKLASAADVAAQAVDVEDVLEAFTQPATA